MPAAPRYPIVVSARSRLLAALLVLGFTLPSSAQPTAVELEPIEVSVERLDRDLFEVPAAVARVGGDTIRRGRESVQLEESLARIPGFFFQNRYNFAQNQRISTRGFGARAPFGVRGIRIRVDGFPETLPDGQSQVDMIDLDSVRSIETLRGPSSVLYGNATGGVIDVTTLTGRDRRGEATARAEFGRHGYRRFAATGGDVSGSWDYHASVSALALDGFREQNAVERRQANVKATRRLAGERALTTVFSAVDLPLAEDPGGLTAVEADADRRAAAPDAALLDAGQDVDQQRLGLTWTDAGSFGGELTARAFFSQRDFTQQLPFFFPGAQNRVGFDRDFFGVGLEYAGATQLGERALRYVVGVDADRQIDDRTRDVIDADRRFVERTVDEEQRATAMGVFGQADLALGSTVDLTAGLRFDRIRFRIDDTLTDETDFSGTRTFNETSQTVALGWEWASGHRAHATVGTSFETPTFTEFARRVGGGFNPEIEPQFAVNREIGARGTLWGRLDYDLALFSIEVRDEISVADDGERRDFFENAARTRREGLELGLEHFVSETLTLSAAYTYSEFRFTEFEDSEGRVLDGKRLPGLPRNNLFLEADWRRGGWFAIVDARHVGAVFADNANTVEVDGYTVLNGRIGREWTRSTGERFLGWIAVDNLMAEEYFANIRVNAAAGRFFEPAPERIVRAGIEVTF